MRRFRKIFACWLALAYLAAPALAPAASAAPRPGVACMAGACHCKAMRPGHPCCCLMAKKIPLAKAYAFKKGDPPCMTEGDCGQAWTQLSQAKPELLPQAPRFALRPASPAQARASLPAQSRLLDKALDKIPLPA